MEIYDFLKVLERIQKPLLDFARKQKTNEIDALDCLEKVNQVIMQEAANMVEAFKNDQNPTYKTLTPQ